MNSTREQLYTFWRNFENLPLVMSHLKSVTQMDATHSHWVTESPIGGTVEWDAEIVNDVPNELIAWQSSEMASVKNAGSVRFSRAPHDRGTEVKVELLYHPPGGVIGAAIVKLFHDDPDVQVREDLRRFKAIMETGEAPTTTGQPTGKAS